MEAAEPGVGRRGASEWFEAAKLLVIGARRAMARKKHDEHGQAGGNEGGSEVVPEPPQAASEPNNT